MDFRSRAPTVADPVQQTASNEPSDTFNHRNLVVFDTPSSEAIRLNVRVLAQGSTMIIYQVCSPPASRLTVGSRVQLYRNYDGGYTGLSRPLAAMRAPERDSVDFILERERSWHPTLLLNVSLALDWAELPPWAQELHASARDSLPSAYPQPTVLEPPVSRPLPSITLRTEYVARTPSPDL